jgi:tetratricopeptide (TPR) repeat protein
MGAVLSAFVFAAFLLPAAGRTQDLGSANELFGGAKKTAPPAGKKTATPPKRTAKPTESAKKVQPASAKRRPAGNAVSLPARPEAAKTGTSDLRAYEALLLKGNSSRDERDYSAAESSYLKAREIAPGDARAAIGLGNVYSDQQLWDKAEGQYRTALQLAPSDPWVHISLSYVLSQPVFVSDLAARYAESERLARRAAELAPQNALAFDQLGVALELRGLIGAETESVYRRALQLDPQFAPAYAHLGRLLRKRGQLAEAQAYYEQAIQKAGDAGTMILVAEVLQSEQRFRESEGLLRQAVASDPANPTGLMLLGRTLSNLERYAEAETVLRKALDVSVNGFRPNLLLASLYLRQSRIELAENALLQALRSVSPPEHADLAREFESAGEAYEKAGKIEEAERCYRRAVALDPGRTTSAAKLTQLGKRK